MPDSVAGLPDNKASTSTGAPYAPAGVASADGIFVVLQRLAGEVQQLRSKLEQCNVASFTANQAYSAENLASAHRAAAADVTHHYEREVIVVNLQIKGMSDCTAL